MKKRLGCLHAHHSNIKYIETVFSEYEIEFIHFVDPGLMYRVTHDESFQISDALRKVKEKINYMASCNVEAILITCTNYIALLKEEELSISVPIIKIDEPFFDYVCSVQQPQSILFTNPSTVEGTMSRLFEHAKKIEKSLDIEVLIIDDTFELIMQGKQEEYDLKVAHYLKEVINDDKKIVSVAQLSMVDASKQVENDTSIEIMNPLNTLVDSVVKQMNLDKKNV